MRPANFTIDVFGDQSFEGFTSGEYWNGWARPYFTFEQGQRIAAAHRAQGMKAWYDEGEDAFSFEMNGGEIDTFTAEAIGGSKLYAIGAGCWIWEDGVK